VSLDRVFKAYDIRGVYPDEIDEALVRRIGNVFAHFTGAQHLVVGHDMRESSPALAAAFIEGATLAGADVTDLGLASTDLVYFAAGRYDAPAAMLTASHNPAEYNGIKMCLAGARPIGEDTGLFEIRDLAIAGVAPTGTPGTVTTRDVLAEFAEHVHSFVDLDRLAPLKIVADTANGMGGLVAPAVFAGLPFDVEIMYGELDGTFPNHEANPLHEANLDPVRELVRSTHAPIGMSLDGDAWDLTELDGYETPIKDAHLTDVVSGDLNNDGRKDLVFQPTLRPSADITS
jgi:phosphomannomutase